MPALRHATPPSAPSPTRPTAARAVISEVRLPAQWARLVFAAPRLARRRPRRPARVVLVPGWRAPEAALEPLRRYLGWLGHDARHWGFGTNTGRLERDVPRLAATIAGPVVLVGWSLGGVVAREVARDHPDEVTRVVTFGTPLTGPGHTVAARTWGEDVCARLAARALERERERPIRVPIDVVFSRRDRVVSWPASIDRASPHAVHHEVRATHIGLGIDPDVWAIVADAADAR